MIITSGSRASPSKRDQEPIVAVTTSCSVPKAARPPARPPQKARFCGVAVRTVQSVRVASTLTRWTSRSCHRYTSEYRTGLTKAKAIAAAAGASIAILGTTPAHNTASPADDLTVVALNKAATALATEFGFHFVDLYHPLIAKCGPVPWADNG